ncbi:MAG: hypothetical protein Kow0032_14060 [Methyloligellaceae bacterium]
MSASSLDLRREGAGFARFLLVGGMGFLIDAGLLALAVHGLGLDPFAARLVSILCAVTATWVMHRHWTFHSRDPRALAEWARYLGVNCAGAALNFALYALCLITVPAFPPLGAMALASAVALLVNFAGARFWAFRPLPLRRG